MAGMSSILPSRAAKSQNPPIGSNESRREDWRKAKELEEARKAGTAPALTDEEGKDINPHIPQYIATVPWYVGIDHPTLRHQRQPEESIEHFNKLGDWYKKGVSEVISTKFRKGACANCGSMTHKKKDCVERPRKVGARFTGDQIAPDEHLQPNLHLDYDGKRDRWNGYDPQEHERVIQEFAKVEEAKKHLKVKKLYDDMLSGEAKEQQHQDAGSEDEEDEDKYADNFDMPGTNFDSKRRITVRNLRIREDTAKYLRNLDPNSAYYDPKTRSMRKNPYVDLGKPEEHLEFAGENFVRSSGDTLRMASAQMFAWDAERKGTDVHLQADPTKLELLQTQFTTKKEDFKEKQKSSILDKYGGAEHLDAPPRELLLAQTEDYVEYSKHGTLIKGLEKAKAKSRYEEDVYINNHTSIWGSFWKNGSWGYCCCHSMVKMSYCVGEAGRSARESSAPLALMAPGLEEDEEEEPVKSLMEQHKEKLQSESLKKKEKKNKKKNKKNKKKSKKVESSSSSSSSSESEDEEKIRQEKIQKAIKEQAQQEREAERLLKIDERKRPYNS
ncbi:putative pre-mRNA-splicing factor SLU7 [Apostichopus japonicus]|uniref:Pre-mRNA-splicing factor SLU7 n=1 Tax=Stichopus japonicus TaxID=307972 RepID=A0A2G8KLE2_STIJA|nr:putative pre-mRNA-splicing factor SLU7 [Apostichopus japonicus]